MTSKRCLVTGGTGFIGYNLVKHLQSLGHDVIITGTENENTADVSDLIVGYDLMNLDWSTIGKIDVLFHQAAIVDTLVLDRDQMITANFEAGKVLFEQAVMHGCKNIVYASSTAVYGNEPAPYVEGVTKMDPLNPYAESKKLLDDFAMAFAHQHPEITVVGLRYCNVYGPHDTHKGKMRAYVAQMAEQMKTGNPKMFSPGDQKRDWIYVKDVVRANVLASNAKESCIVNCGSGKAASFNELVPHLNTALGVNRTAEYIDNPFVGRYQDYTECDMSLAKEKIGFVPEYDVARGIADLYGSH